MDALPPPAPPTRVTRGIARRAARTITDAETPADAEDGLRAGPRRRRSDTEEVSLALTVGGLSVTVAEHSTQIAALLAADSRTANLLQSVAQKVDQLAGKMTVDNGNHERTQELLTKTKQEIGETKQQIGELLHDRQERLNHEQEVKEALETAQRAAHDDREENRRRVAIYFKRGAAVAGTLILVALPSTINTAPAAWHHWLYPVLALLAMLYVFLGIPALLWETRHKTP